MFSQIDYESLACLAIDFMSRLYLSKKDRRELKMWEQMLKDKEFFKGCTASIVGRKKDIEYIIEEEISGKEIHFKTKSKKGDFLLGYEGSAKLSYLVEGRRVELHINPENEKGIYFRISISDEK